MSEKTPLLVSKEDRKDSFYFINNTSTASTGKTPPNLSRSIPSNQDTPNVGNSGSNSENNGWLSGIGSFFGKLIQGNRNREFRSGRGISQLERKVPIKVEPKVFFANERTFLAWLHMAVTLASISIAILAFSEANDYSIYYGLALMPVAIAFCFYALYLFLKRARMIRRKDPGPYEDRLGPVVLSVLLALSIVINFIMKLYETNT